MVWEKGGVSVKDKSAFMDRGEFGDGLGTRVYIVPNSPFPTGIKSEGLEMTNREQRGGKIEDIFGTNTSHN